MAQIIIKIIASLVTEKLFRELLANGLEVIIKHTDNDIDNQMVGPIVKA